MKHLICTVALAIAACALADNCDVDEAVTDPPGCGATWGGTGLYWTCPDEDGAERWITETLIFRRGEGGQLEVVERVVDTDGADDPCRYNTGDIARSRMELPGFQECDYCRNSCGDITIWFGDQRQGDGPVLHVIRDTGLEGDVPIYAGHEDCGLFFKWPTQPQEGRVYVEVEITPEMIVPQETNFPHGRIVFGTTHGKLFGEFEPYSPPWFDDGIAHTRPPIRGVAGLIQASGIVASCAGDLDWDGSIGHGDLLAALAAWGQSGVRDTTSNAGTMDIGDVLNVLRRWGQSCSPD